MDVSLIKGDLWKTKDPKSLFIELMEFGIENSWIFSEKTERAILVEGENLDM